MDSPSKWRFDWIDAAMQCRKVTPTAKTVAHALSIKFANNETGRIDPGLDALSDYLGISRDSVKRAIKLLVDTGWLHRTEGRGSGNRTTYTLLTPGKVVSLRAQEKPSKTDAVKGCNRAPLKQKKGASIHLQKCNHAPSYNKDKQSLEQKARATPYARPASIDQHMQTRFEGRSTDGPRIIPKEKWDALNAWGEWLDKHGFGKLIDLPIVQIAEKTGGMFFWLPTLKPPVTQTGTDQAIEYFTALVDWEAARHAAQ